MGTLSKSRDACAEAMSNPRFLGSTIQCPGILVASFVCDELACLFPACAQPKLINLMCPSVETQYAFKRRAFFSRSALLQARLAAQGADLRGCTEKTELVQMLEQPTSYKLQEIKFSGSIVVPDLQPCMGQWEEWDARLVICWSFVQHENDMFGCFHAASKTVKAVAKSIPHYAKHL